MWTGIGLKLVQWLTGVGVGDIVSKATEAYTAHVQAGVDSGKIDADIIARQIDLAKHESELQAGLAKEPGYVRQCFAYPVAFYYAKIFVWDKVLALGATDALSPELEWTARTIIVSYFGCAAVATAMRIVRGR